MHVSYVPITHLSTVLYVHHYMYDIISTRTDAIHVCMYVHSVYAWKKDDLIQDPGGLQMHVQTNVQMENQPLWKRSGW